MMQLTLNQTHVKFAAIQEFHLFQNWELISNYCASDGVGRGTAGCVLMQQAVK
jgi:hypothetical protein